MPKYRSTYKENGMLLKCRMHKMPCHMPVSFWHQSEHYCIEFLIRFFHIHIIFLEYLLSNAIIFIVCIPLLETDSYYSHRCCAGNSSLQTIECLQWRRLLYLFRSQLCFYLQELHQLASKNANIHIHKLGKCIIYWAVVLTLIMLLVIKSS